MANGELDRMIERIRSQNITLSEDEERAQLVSFAYGNLAIERPGLRREVVEKIVAERFTKQT